MTVIATGFDRSARSEQGSTEPETRRDAVQAKRGFEDYLSTDEWKRITEMPAAPRGKQYLLGRNDEEELDIPTVLRESRFAGEKSEA